jgi:hypothetical protein
MRTARVVFATLGLIAGSFVPAPAPHSHESGIAHAATCTPYGKGACTACKNCNACKNCSARGGSCTVCRR